MHRCNNSVSFVLPPLRHPPILLNNSVHPRLCRRRGFFRRLPYAEYVLEHVQTLGPRLGEHRHLRIAEGVGRASELGEGADVRRV